MKASASAGVQIVARLDFQPAWARKDGATNGPPDNYQDYADFVSAFVSRYGAGSSIGGVGAIEVWNEVNLDREWGGASIDKQQAADYVRLLGAAYSAAKAADRAITVITAGLSPTGVTDGHSADDAQYLQWLYDAGLKGKYDVLGAHGNVQAPEVDAPPNSLPHFPHPSFYFRRIEQLRELMVKNGEADKRMWLLEFGWTADTQHPNYAWFAVSEDKKGAPIRAWCSTFGRRYAAGLRRRRALGLAPHVARGSRPATGGLTEDRSLARPNWSGCLQETDYRSLT